MDSAASRGREDFDNIKTTGAKTRYCSVGEGMKKYVHTPVTAKCHNMTFPHVNIVRACA